MSENHVSSLLGSSKIREFGAQSVVARELLDDAGKAQVEELLIRSLVSKATAQGYQRVGDYFSVRWIDPRAEFPPMSMDDYPEDVWVVRALIRVIKSAPSSLSSNRRLDQ